MSLRWVGVRQNRVDGQGGLLMCGSVWETRVYVGGLIM